jgi:hypothetical protein
MRHVFLADVVVTVHLAFVVAVLLLLLLILVGWLAGWQWVRNFWFRLAHLAAILVVAGQPLLHIECPLTTLERHLRGGPGQLHELDDASAVGRFCNDVLYFEPGTENGQPPLWLLLCYLSVALLIVATWVFVLPRLPWRAGKSRLPPANDAAPTAHSSISR